MVSLLVGVASEPAYSPQLIGKVQFKVAVKPLDLVLSEDLADLFAELGIAEVGLVFEVDQVAMHSDIDFARVALEVQVGPVHIDAPFE